MSDAIAIGVDAGGTKVEGLLVDVGDDGRILARKVVPTPAQDQEASARSIVTLARGLMKEHSGVRALGVGAAGMVDLTGMMRFAPNIAWREFPLQDRIAQEVGLPTMVDNDANVAAWGEYRF